MTSFAIFMQSGGWALYALIAAAFSAGFYLVNQYLKQPGAMLVFWMRVLIVIVMTPFMAKLQLPQSNYFYAAVTLTALFGTGADVRTLNVSAKYGAGVVSRVMPITVWGSFFLWLVFHPALLMQYVAHPLNTLGILGALGGCVWFAMRLNRCTITRAAFPRNAARALRLHLDHSLE